MQDGRLGLQRGQSMREHEECRATATCTVVFLHLH
jgi:hypothetical protein